MGKVPARKDFWRFDWGEGGPEVGTPEKYDNDPNASWACEPIVAPRKCSATTDAESAASLQTGDLVGVPSLLCVASVSPALPHSSG